MGRHRKPSLAPPNKLLINPKQSDKSQWVQSTNKNNPTTINKYNNLEQQAAKTQSPQFCIKGELRQTFGFFGCDSVTVVNWLSSDTKEKEPSNNQ